MSLVEVDLLRSGQWPFAFPRTSVPRSHGEPYRACIHRARAGPEYAVYRLPLTQRLPKLPIPLRAGDDDAVLDLQAIVDETYRKGGFEALVNYAADADPPLTGEAAAWADELLRAAGKRPAVT